MALEDAKVALAVVFVAAAAAALLSMLSLMGRGEQRVRPGLLKATHRASGYVFTVSLLVLAVLGARLLSAAGDGMSFRAVLHWTSAVVLLVLLALKIAIARRYRKLLTYVPPLGLAVFTFAMLVAAVSLGFTLIAGR